MTREGPVCLASAAFLLAGCSSSAATPAAASREPPHAAVDAGQDATTKDAAGNEASPEAAPHACTRAVMDFTGGHGFFGSPFPSDARLTAAGTPDLTGYPNPQSNAVAGLVLGMISSNARAFGTTSSVYFQLTGGLSLPGGADPHTSLAPGASIYLVDVDPSSPSLGARIPTESLFLADGGPYGASDLLAVLPYPGMTLAPGTRYAAVLLTTQHDDGGSPLCAAPEMSQIAAGKAPDGMSAATLTEYQSALAYLAKSGVSASSVAAVTVFTTDTPTAQFEAVRSAMLALPLPAVSSPWVAHEVFPTYCVFESTIPMPEYQGGTPPYSSTGGGWVFDDAGEPVLQRMEEANFVVTIPRAPMPYDGYPIVDMSRTGAGGNRPLVDRGQEAINGGPPIIPGSGPAMFFAAAGYAGASIDGPLGGLRNPIMPDSADDEDFTTFNVQNPEALRDNIRQSAVELSLTASILASLTFDASSCPPPGVDAGSPQGGGDGGTSYGGGDSGVPPRIVHFDATKMALFSHSMGSTISPLTLAFEPRYRGAILSGAGGSWIENIIFKQEPLAVKPAVELLLGIGIGYSLTEGDPMVNMFQWAAEAADPPVYDGRTIRHPVDGPARNVLKVQGIIDNYILPPICNATSLSLGLDLGGPELDSDNPGLAMFTPFSKVMDLGGVKAVALPAGGDVATDGGVVTAIVTQHPSDGIEDGHEVIFQTDPPKHEYVCFLSALAAGKTPVVLPDAPALAPCP